MGDSTISFLGAIQNDIDLIWHGGDVSYVSETARFLCRCRVHLILLCPRPMTRSFTLDVPPNSAMRMCGTST
jgi:hypothetical protein